MRNKLLCAALLCCLLLPLLEACQGNVQQQQSQPTDTAPLTQVETGTLTESVGAIQESTASPETEPDDGRTVVEIECSMPDAVWYEGGPLVQDVTDNAFWEVKVYANDGYEYKGYEIDGELHKSHRIKFQEVAKDTKVKIVVDYATRELPIVLLNTNNADINSTETYTEMTFSLVNTEDELNSLTGGVRLRGNSTAGYDKKPYRIKFDQKVSLFGLKKAKSWVLLAEYLDPSCMHNYTAFTLGAASDKIAFTPTPHHVNLYLNGEYMGIYTLCEQVQENKGRMNLEQTITEDMTSLDQFNFYVCLDEDAQFDPTAVEGEDYFYVAWTNNYYSLKYPQRADFCSDEQFYSFFAQLEAYYNEILLALRDGDAERIQQYLDVDSLIDHMIIDQIMGERDHVWKSFYSYQVAGEKLAFGPIWDYDYSLYIPWTGAPNEYFVVVDTIEYSNDFFLGVARTPELYEMLCERYQSHYSDVLDDCIDYVQNYRSGISESLALNQQKWYSDTPNLTDDNYDFLVAFLKNRKKVLDRAWR